MDYNKILTERWKNIDEYLKEYLKKYNKVDKKTREELQDMIDGLNINYDDLNKIVPKNKKTRLDSKIQDVISDINEDNYFFFYLFNILNKNAITYREYIEATIYLMFYKQRMTLDEFESFFIEKVIEESYTAGISDIKPLKPRKSFVLFTDEILYLILNIPLIYGTREDYMMSLDLLNAQELLRKIITSIQINATIDLFNGMYEAFFNKCRNKYICINEDKSSGAMENLIETYANLGYIEAGKQNGVRKCRFIAEIDKRTTKMCESLNNQIFDLDKVNTYQRYSDYDKRIVTYTTKGLVVGENLPPISNHFHWCRSTITYLIDNEKEIEHIRENIKIANDYDREQFLRYKKYYGDEITDDIEEFAKMRYNNPDEWNHLKINYNDRKIRYKIRNNFNLKVNENKNNRHIENTKEFLQYTKKNSDISVLTINNEEAQKVINKFAGFGYKKKKRNGSFDNKEVIKADRQIGYVYDINGEKVYTNKGTIHYSNTGTHLVPTLKE